MAFSAAGLMPENLYTLSPEFSLFSFYSCTYLPRRNLPLRLRRCRTRSKQTTRLLGLVPIVIRREIRIQSDWFRTIRM